VKSPPPEVNSGRKFDIQSRHNAFLKILDNYGKIIGLLKSSLLTFLLIEGFKPETDILNKKIIFLIPIKQYNS